MSNGFKIADGYVEVHGKVDGVDNDVAGISKTVNPTATKVGFGIAKSIVTGFIAYGVGRFIGGQIKEAFSEASDLNETVSKSTAIFGDGIGVMMEWGKTAPWALGLSSSAALESAAGFGDLFSQLGFSADAANEMSRNTVQMAADLGSFNNLPTADVADRITAAFRGEYDSLQKVIPNISAARVESEALAMTGKTLASELTAQEKASAVLAIVMNDGTRAMGDFDKTSAGFANSTKTATGIVDNLQAKIGQGLLPIGEQFLGLFNNRLGPALLVFADTTLPKITAGVQTGIDFFTNWRDNLGSFVDWIGATDFGGPIVESFPELISLGRDAAGIFQDKIWPAVKNVSAILVQAAEDTGISTWGLFVSTLKLVTPVIDWVSGLVLGLSDFLRENQLLVNGIVVAFTAWKVITGIITAVTVAQTAFMAISYGAAGATYAQGAALLIYRGAMLAGSIATGVMTAAQWAFNVAASANPIGLIIIAVAALIAIIILLVMNWDTVIKFLGDTWNGFVGWFTGVMEGFAGWWTGVWEGFLGFVSDLWNGWVSFVQGLFIGYVSTIMDIGRNVSNWWNGLWAGIFGLATDLWNGYVNWAVGVFSGMLGFFRDIGAGLVSWWNGLWGGLASFVGDAFNGVVGFVKGMINNIIRLVNGAIGGINNLGAAASQITGGAISWKVAPLPQLAKGSNNAPDTFIAGERGPELITGAAGSTVRPYSATKDLLARDRADEAPVVMNFHEGAFTIDLSKIKSLEDLIELFEKLSKTARSGRGQVRTAP